MDFTTQWYGFHHCKCPKHATMESIYHLLKLHTACQKKLQVLISKIQIPKQNTTLKCGGQGNIKLNQDQIKFKQPSQVLRYSLREWR